MCSVSIQYPFTIWLKQQQFILIVIPLSHYSAYTQFSVRFLIRTSPQLFSSHATCFHTRLYSLWILLPVLSWYLYRRVSSLMNTLEGECLCLCENSINVSKLFMFVLAELWLPVYLFIPFCIMYCCCCLFTPDPFLYWCFCYIFVYSLIK